MLSINDKFLIKRLVIATLAAFVFAGLVPQPGQAQTEGKEQVRFSQNDRDQAIKQFSETQENFLRALKGLSVAQLNFKPNENSWSVGQTAEHIVLSETAILQGFIKKAMKTPLNANPKVFRVNDVAVTLAITNRLKKFNAPQMIQPTQQSKAVGDLISGFKKAREANLTVIKTTKVDLRNHFMPNPLMGTIDVYQWFLFLNGHTERHLAQIAEIKAHKNFPKQ